MTPGQMLWRHRRGVTLDQLAALTGLSRYAVHRKIKTAKWKCGEVVITERMLRMAIKEGLTIRQIADRHMCSVGCIERRIHRYGIKMRPRGNPLWANMKREQSKKAPL